MTQTKRTRRHIASENDPSAAEPASANPQSVKRQRRAPVGPAAADKAPPHHESSQQHHESASEDEEAPAEAEGSPASVAAAAVAAAAAADPRFAGAAEFSEDDGSEHGSDGAAALSEEGAEERVDAPAGGGKGKGKLSGDRLQRMKAAYARRGVVYISRIPPHMVRAVYKPRPDSTPQDL